MLTLVLLKTFGVGGAGLPGGDGLADEVIQAVTDLSEHRVVEQ